MRDINVVLVIGCLVYSVLVNIIYQQSVRPEDTRKKHVV